MSKQSKQARKARIAKEWSENRKHGNKGPSRTEKKNHKKDAWYIRKDWLRKKPGADDVVEGEDNKKKKHHNKKHIKPERFVGTEEQ